MRMRPVCEEEYDDQHLVHALLMRECNYARRVRHPTNVLGDLLIQLIDPAICEGLCVFVPIDELCQSIEICAEGFLGIFLPKVRLNGWVVSVRDPRL